MRNYMVLLCLIGEDTLHWLWLPEAMDVII
jgi:hypothetical protein